MFSPTSIFLQQIWGSAPISGAAPCLSLMLHFYPAFLNVRILGGRLPSPSLFVPPRTCSLPPPVHVPCAHSQPWSRLGRSPPQLRVRPPARCPARPALARRHRGLSPRLCPEDAPSAVSAQQNLRRTLRLSSPSLILVSNIPGPLGSRGSAFPFVPGQAGSPHCPVGFGESLVWGFLPFALDFPSSHPSNSYQAHFSPDGPRHEMTRESIWQRR